MANTVPILKELRNIMTFGTKRLKDVIEDMNHMGIESQVIITSSLIIID